MHGPKNLCIADGIICFTNEIHTCVSAKLSLLSVRASQFSSARVTSLLGKVVYIGGSGMRLLPAPTRETGLWGWTGGDEALKRRLGQEDTLESLRWNGSDRCEGPVGAGRRPEAHAAEAPVPAGVPGAQEAECAALCPAPFTASIAWSVGRDLPSRRGGCLENRDRTRARAPARTLARIRANPATQHTLVHTQCG